MPLYFKKYRFAPKWYFTLGTIFLCLLFVRLGFWQLHRATENQQLQTSFNTRLHTTPILLVDLPKNADINYYAITITGHYDNAHHILLDNKIHDHQVGYEVITPFLPNQSKSSVLINRGWLPANADRRILPDIPPIDGEQTVMGNIYIMPGKPLLLNKTLAEEKSWPMRVQAIDFKQLEKLLNTPIHPFIVWLSPNAKGGFVRNWQPIAISPEKNKGYAVQWFSFAIVLVIIFLVLNIKPLRKNN